MLIVRAPRLKYLHNLEFSLAIDEQQKFNPSWHKRDSRVRPKAAFAAKSKGQAGRRHRGFRLGAGRVEHRTAARNFSCKCAEAVGVDAVWNNDRRAKPSSKGLCNGALLLMHRRKRDRPVPVGARGGGHPSKTDRGGPRRRRRRRQIRSGAKPRRRSTPEVHRPWRRP